MDSHKPNLIDAAIQLAKTKGYVNMNLREISRMAGVSRPLIHYHFKNRDGLISLMLQEAVRRREYHIILQAWANKEPLLDVTPEVLEEAKRNI